jgi:hypothetical protein
MIAVDRAFTRNDHHVAALCLAEAVKDLEARLKAVEAAKAK